MGIWQTILVLGSLTLVSTEDVRTLPPPRLMVGDELVYVGTVTEASEKFDERFQKVHDLEVRVLVLEAGRGHLDCAVMTKQQPRLDPRIIQSTTSLAGTDSKPTESTALVTLELVRIEANGQVKLIDVSAEGLRADSKTLPMPPDPIDTPPTVETGFVIPLPSKPAVVGGAWDTAEVDRPPIRWSCIGEAIWNGARAMETKAVQESEGWNSPYEHRHGWRRTERLLISPIDGTATTVERRIERRQGKKILGWMEVKYELQGASRVTGDQFGQARREAEMSWILAQELQNLVEKKATARDFESRLVKLKQFQTAFGASPFRPALVSTQRRYEAAMRGELPVVKPRGSYQERAIGTLAPDFVAPHVAEVKDVRLGALQGKPVVLGFYRPESKTSEGTLMVLEALQNKYGSEVHVLGMSILEETPTAQKQRERLQLTTTILDGRAQRLTYGVETYPKFFLLDSGGRIQWRFDGYGPETGYLLQEQLLKIRNTPRKTP
ncbi:MAG: peroxiredoxin family protein [Fimbriiglobus sp.]